MMKFTVAVLFLYGLACTKNEMAPPPTVQELVPPPHRAHHELVYDEANRRVFMTAGSTPLNGGSSYTFFNDVWTYDGQQWQQSGTAGDERSGIRMAYDSKRSRIYSYGGFDGAKPLSDLRVFENGSWTTLTDLPEMKAAEPGLAYDRDRDRLVAFGGLSGGSNVNDATWEWDGAAWTKFAGNGPAGRQAFVMAYDSQRKRTVLYGGMGAPGQLFDDTWEFDGNQWIKVSDQGPGARFAAGYAYDSSRGLLLVFGGAGGGSVFGDTWSWDGTAWKKLAETGPPARMMGYMAYDRHRDRVVLYGGRPSWPNDVDDTWEWDGTAWREIK
jgi:hypothetical protein